MRTLGTSLLSRIHRNVWIGGAVAALGAAMVAIIIPLGVVVPAHLPARAISPAFWPWLSAWMLVVFGIVIAVQAVRQPAEPKAAKDGEYPLRPRRILGGFACMYLTWAAIPVIGLPGACGILIFVFGKAFGEKRTILLLAVSVVVPFLLYLFFSGIAGVPIPLGWFDT